MRRCAPRLAIVVSIGLAVGCSPSAAHEAAPGSGSAPAPLVDSRPPGSAADDMIGSLPGYYPWDTHLCNTLEDYDRAACPYWIDRDVVRCAAYRACIAAKACPSYGHNTCFHEFAQVPQGRGDVLRLARRRTAEHRAVAEGRAHRWPLLSQGLRFDFLLPASRE